MAINIKRERVQELAREAAERTGRSQTDAIETALERYLAELAADGDDRELRIDELLARVDAEMTPQTRAALLSDDLYDADGLPR
ncbi:type II toxin-antitoxin system VapB family antitoxin [Lapillicoccus jejuensis]|uniref:Antitoxin VapB n=1 Tax=Lapillicoccus jejuensis TaxID=402171 RepID=A0A542E6X7_9MICO|nr:type II toxin-antitoxin system VapB family antitoxin [Lapillicoccus jejuensis]TQJ06964.1 antitoxin VapB [Lapillicoccus jejuensis]TQJ11091.1 antitoxin VapB [Lapillicoccus jejuensis]